MSQTFYNSLRKTNNSLTNRPYSQGKSTSSIAINYNKREKLRTLLINKFMKKYNLSSYDPILDNEVTYFLQKETLTDKDLRELDRKIETLLNKKSKLAELSNTLRKENDYQIQPETEKIEEAKSVKSAMSGGSRLSNVNKKKCDLEDDDLLSERNEPIERIEFCNEKDEWNAINKYNQKIHEETKYNERLKDKEIKNRTKEDLDNQIKQKLVRLNEVKLKEKEYDKVTIDHVEKLNRLEQQRKQELKEKMLREKENRDAQRKDEMKRKKVEIGKNKKYDRELCKYIIIQYHIL
jgi:hypothetical protein